MFNFSGQPDSNPNTGDMGQENCVYVRDSSPAYWEDGPCNLPHNVSFDFVCEVPGNTGQ